MDKLTYTGWSFEGRHLYAVRITNPVIETEETGLLLATCHSQAEEKGREWARLWAGQGYRFAGAEHINFGHLIKGEVVTVT